MPDNPTLSGRLAGEQLELIVGARFRELRTGRGWSQQYVADQMTELGWPMHQSTVQKMEAGTRPLRLAEAVSLAALHGLPLVAMFYLPLPAEPASVRRGRERLRQIDEGIESIRANLHATFNALADLEIQRAQVARSLLEQERKGGRRGESQKAR